LFDLVDPLIQKIPDFLNPLIESGRPIIEKYGLWGVCFGLFAETFFFTGVIFPGFGLLVAAGYFMAEGILPPLPTVAAAVIGGVIGDQASYLLGYYFGHRLLRRKYDESEKIRLSMEKEGPLLLLFYHYAPPLRALLPCTAGTTRYNFRRWILFDALGVILWIAVVLALGFTAHGALHSHGNVAVLVINTFATLIFILVIWRLYRNLDVIKKCGKSEDKKRRD